MTILNVIRGIIAALLALYFIRAWARSGFWLPRYVHWMAGIMFVFGCVMVYLTHGPGVKGVVKEMAVPFGLAAIVYGVFVLYGGANAALRHRLGKSPQGPEPPVNL